MSFFFSFLSFSVFLQIERERERERERVYKIGYKEKQSQSYLSYLDGFLWRIFLLSRALLLPGVLGFSSVRHESCPTTNFLISFFRWREGVPTSVLGSQPIVWLLPSSFPCQVTRVRSLSTNICCSPCDPPSFFTIILWRLATVNSNTRIVVMLFLSSQWDTTWHLEQFDCVKTNNVKQKYRCLIAIIETI